MTSKGGANENPDNNSVKSGENTITSRDVNWADLHHSNQQDTPTRMVREKSEETERGADSESTNFLTGLDGLREEPDDIKDRPRCLRFIRSVLEHRYCHYIIIALVIFDVFLVVSSLLVEIRAVEMKCQEHLRRARESESLTLSNLQLACSRNLNVTLLPSGPQISLVTKVHNNSDAGYINNSTTPEYNVTARFQELLIVMLGAFDVQQLRSLEVVEEALHFTGLAIICLFVVEVSLKIIAFYPEFFRSKIDVLDMLLVYISFICEVALSVSDVRMGVREAVFIAMLLRLWRIARIVSGVVISMKTKYEGEITRLKTKLKATQCGSRLSLCNNNSAHGHKSTFLKSRHLSEANFSIQLRENKFNSTLSHEAEEVSESPIVFSATGRIHSTPACNR